MKQAALRILEQRAAAAGLKNVRCHAGMIETFSDPFDVGMALHCCGNATDHAMLKCTEQRAAMLSCPCCVGKLVFSMSGGSSFSPHVKQWHGLVQEQKKPGGLLKEQQHSRHPDGGTALQGQKQGGQLPDQQEAQQQMPDTSSISNTASSIPAVRHPRSDALLRCLPDPERTFRLLASQADTTVHKTADGADEGEEEGEGKLQGHQDVLSLAAVLCKVHVELDRREAAREAGYSCALFKLFAHHCQAKTDFLVGVPREKACWAQLHPCLD